MSPAEPRVFLIGLMGSGKSTIGRRLAAERGCPYIDNDDTIAELAGRSTVALAGVGGSLLHEWEARYAHYLRVLPAPFVAGIPASAADRGEELRMLRHTGCLIYLRCDTDTLVQRVGADAPRPWLTGDTRAIIAGMFDRRDAILSASCDRVVDATMPIDRILSALTGDDVEPLDRTASSLAGPSPAG